MTLEDWCVDQHARYLRSKQPDGPGLHETVSVPFVQTDAVDAPVEMTVTPEPEIPVFVALPIAPDLSAVEQQVVDDTTGRP